MAEFNWDDTVIADGSEFVTFEEGEYPFTVKKFERSMVKNGKNAGKKQADYTLECTRGDGKRKDVHYRIILDTEYSWKITGFFRALGMFTGDNGSEFMPNWDEAVNKTAMCELSVREYQVESETRTTNDVKRVWAATATDLANAAIAGQKAAAVAAAEADEDIPF